MNIIIDTKVGYRVTYSFLAAGFYPPHRTENTTFIKSLRDLASNVGGQEFRIECIEPATVSYGAPLSQAAIDEAMRREERRAGRKAQKEKPERWAPRHKPQPPMPNDDIPF